MILDPETIQAIETNVRLAAVREQIRQLKRGQHLFLIGIGFGLLLGAAIVLLLFPFIGTV